MSSAHSDCASISNIVKSYFAATYQGNEADLRRIFHPDAHIIGILNNQYFDWTLTEFIARVTTKPSAETKAETFDKEILSIEITNNAASVKARARVGDIIFTDYITLLKINGQWLICHKSFTN